MSMNYRTEEYYKRFIELQEKLRKSEEERLKLEMKFNEMVRVTREEEQIHYRKLRTQYKRFLEEDRRRQDRNERILRTLDRIDGRVAVLMAKTERFKLLRQQYHIYLDRVYRADEPKKTEAPQVPKNIADDKKTHIDDKSDLVQTYLQNLSSTKLREMLKKEEESRPRLPVTITTDTDNKYNYSDLYSFNNGEFRPNYANTIADDIMNSIYSKHGRLSDTKLRKPGEFNNNITSASAVSENKFETQPFKNYGGTSLGLRQYPAGFKQHDETKNIVSAAEDTETDDFSESEEILYKNPSEFYKAKCKNSSMMEQAKSTSFDNNFSELNKTQINPILNDQIKDPRRRNVVNDMLVSKPSENQVSHTKDLGSAQIKPVNEFVNQNIILQNPPAENISVDSRRKLIVNDTLPESDISQKDQTLVKPFETTSETNFNQYNKEIMNPQVCDENYISQRKEEIVEPKETAHTENRNFDKDLFTEKPLDEQQLVQKPQTEIVKELPMQDTVEQVDKVKEQEKPQESWEQPQKELPMQSYLDDHQPQQIQQQQRPQQLQEQMPEQRPTQQFVESEQPLTVPTPYKEIDKKNLIQDSIEQPLQQYDENVDSASYDQYNQPVYGENEQLYPQYDETAPPIQQYDDQGQLLQQYDASGQPVGQYDENSQPIQQYDEAGQPIGQYTESTQQIQQYDDQGQPIQQYDAQGQPIQQYDAQGQPMQQYDAQGQPIQQFNQQGEYDAQGQYLQQYGTGQYDEHGQLIPQYDEHDQLIPQYDEHGQLIQQYDESGQLIPQYDAQYGENQQPLQQYDASGQLIQSYDYGEGLQPQYDENGQLIQQTYENQQYYGQEYEQNIEAVGDQQNVAPAPPNVTPVQQNVVPVQQNVTPGQQNVTSVQQNVAPVQQTVEPVQQNVAPVQQNVEPVQENAAPVSQAVIAENEDDVKENKEEPKKTSNVMEMLDTDTESTKQDTKISHDSDFDFSNG